MHLALVLACMCLVSVIYIDDVDFVQDRQLDPYSVLSLESNAVPNFRVNLWHDERTPSKYVKNCRGCLTQSVGRFSNAWRTMRDCRKIFMR